jgi:hypothetical protein
LEQLQQLKMNSEGVQMYSDKFIRLATRVGWNLQSDLATHQYKKGLPSWLLQQLSSAEAALLCKNKELLSVVELVDMAIRIEANQKLEYRHADAKAQV